jgi:hypothetical protein
LGQLCLYPCRSGSALVTATVQRIVEFERIQP